VQDLVELSFNYTIDGSYAELYSAQIRIIYNSLDFNKFVVESIKYGEVIQEDITCHLAYKQLVILKNKLSPNSIANYLFKSTKR